MSDKSHIEWTESTWNPVTGCTKVSQGCKHCYAKHQAWPRLKASPQTVYFGREFEDVQCHPQRLDQPLRWTKPRRIFVNSMSDLFHEAVPESFIDSVWAVMALAPHHTYQILTKRPERMRNYLTHPERYQRVLRAADPFRQMRPKLGGIGISDPASPAWWRQVWLGVSVEDQATADERIPLLLDTPAAVRWISAEPLLGPIRLRRPDFSDGPPGGPLGHGPGWIGPDDGSAARGPTLDWVVVGGESGPGARPCHPDWARSLRDQCQAAAVPFFFKQGSAANWPRHKSFESFPSDLQIREYPHASR
jgi:protein gp37